MNRFKLSELDLWTSYVNKVINETLENVSPISLGPSYKNLSSDDCEVNLSLYRMKKKFEIPVPSNAITRKEKTIGMMVAYDQNHDDFDLDLGDPLVRTSLYKARASLQHILKDYQLGQVEMTTGETLVSAQGDTSILAKLRDLRQWCVTPSCFDLAAKVFYNTIWLRRVAMAHYRTNVNRLYRPEVVRLQNIAYWSKYKHLGYHKACFEIFKRKFRQIITFVHGARITTVPKNNSVDRVIECEALLNMIVQRCVAGGIRNVIKRHFNYDLEDAQAVHRNLIKESHYATIDLSNASNSNWRDCVDFLYDRTRCLRHLLASRSEVVSLPNGDLHHMRMIAPMGNGFTFELMTLTLLVIARQFSSDSSVFGDDIIIPNEYALEYIHVLSALGYEVNESKTFVSSQFRESCGAFFCDRYLRSYDFTYCEDPVDANVALSKLWNLRSVASIFEATYLNLIAHCPAALMYCCDGDADKLDFGVPVTRSYHKRVHRKDDDIKTKRGRLLESASIMCRDLCYQSSDISLFAVLRKESERYRSAPISHLRSKCWIAFYLYNGRVSRPSRRRTKVKLSLALITNHSNIVLSP